MEAFGIFDMCEEFPKDAKDTTTRGSWPESSDMTVQERKDSHLRQHISNRQTGGHACSPTRIRKSRMCTAGLRKNDYRGTTPEVDVKRQLYGRRKAAKQFNKFVVAATDGLGIGQSDDPEQRQQ